MIYLIQGEFGGGKTSLAVYLMMMFSKDKNAVIWTNIKVNGVVIQRAHFFDENEICFIDILRTINADNDLDRLLHCEPMKNSHLEYYERSKFHKHYLFLDESNSLYNSRNSKDFDTDTSLYLNQVRKIFTDVFIIAQDGMQTEKSLRRYCDWVYVIKPLFRLPFFKLFKKIYLEKWDMDKGVPIKEEYAAKDAQGDLIMKERPISLFQFIYFQPKVWRMYDDLFKNIRDPSKYKNLNTVYLRERFENEPTLLEICKNDPRFEQLLITCYGSEYIKI